MALSHQHPHLKKREANPDDGDFILKTIYKTVDKTFDGPIGGYATLVKNQVAETGIAVDPDDAPSGVDESLVMADPTTSGLFSDPVPTEIPEPTESLDGGSGLVMATGEATLPSTEADTEPSNTASAPRPSSTADESSGGGGTSAGVKAGIAFGVLGGVLVVALLIFFIFNRHKKRARGDSPENGSEKVDMASRAPRSQPTQDAHNAPRLSLRPVTQFFPNFNNGEKQASKGPGISLTPQAAAAPTAATSRPLPSPNPFDRPATSQSTHSLNPFGSNAERPVSPISEQASMYSVRSPSPVSNRSVAGAMTTGGVRQTSMHVDIDQMDFTLPPPSRGAPSPTGTEFSMSSIAPGSNAPPSSGAAAIAAAGGPRNTAVHRVQLDFKPTLEDEMELRAGELVRLLHEYDDGWALCIRLDRSRQGVVPRTCLSTRPVKPRAPAGASRNGPPINPQGPNYPYQGRPESPARPRTATGPQGRGPQRGPGGQVPGQAM